jgi:hypothetical protein
MEAEITGVVVIAARGSGPRMPNPHTRGNAGALAVIDKLQGGLHLDHNLAARRAKRHDIFFKHKGRDPLVSVILMLL